MFVNDTKIRKPKVEENLCQGDVFCEVKYIYIAKETDDTVEVVELVFPLAIIISQACDVDAISNLSSTNGIKTTKYMPSILMCPIYDEETLRSSDHLSEISPLFHLKNEHLYSSKVKDIIENNTHYRFHFLNLKNPKEATGCFAIDFKQYFSVPVEYLSSNKQKRQFRLETLFAEQVTLKFAVYLSRVAVT
jgi:hypothetical protein